MISDVTPPSDTISLSYRQSISLVKNLLFSPELKIEIVTGRLYCLVFNNCNQKLLEFRMPLCFPNYQAGQNFLEYSNSLTSHPGPYVILLIRAGQSALGYFNRGEIVEHKVIRKYMVRKKQGKAQIKFQKRKRSTSAGARIRMTNSILFFEEINLKLQDWFKTNPVHKIIYSCTPLLWSMIFRSKISPPFEKKDQRLIKVPLHLPDPLYKTLLHANYYSQHGQCKMYTPSDEDSAKVIDTILKIIAL
jgi:hypothetical protein